MVKNCCCLYHVLLYDTVMRYCIPFAIQNACVLLYSQFSDLIVKRLHCKECGPKPWVNGSTEPLVIWVEGIPRTSSAPNATVASCRTSLYYQVIRCYCARRFDSSDYFAAAQHKYYRIPSLPLLPPIVPCGFSSLHCPCHHSSALCPCNGSRRGGGSWNRF